MKRLFSEQLFYALCEKCPNMEVFFDPYFPAFGLNTEKHGSEKTPYLETLNAVIEHLWTPASMKNFD